MSERPNPEKRANQTRRAQKLVALFIGKLATLDTPSAHGVSGNRQLEYEAAKRFSTAGWVALGEELDFDHPPSSETIAMAVAMMKGRAEADAIYYARNPGLRTAS